MKQFSEEETASSGQLRRNDGEGLHVSFEPSLQHCWSRPPERIRKNSGNELAIFCRLSGSLSVAYPELIRAKRSQLHSRAGENFCKCVENHCFFAMFLLISWCVARLDFQMAFAKTVFFAMVSLISHAPARLDVETAIFKTHDFAMLCACTGLFR